MRETLNFIFIYIELTALVVLPNGDIVTGDSKGYVRGLRQAFENDTTTNKKGEDVLNKKGKIMGDNQRIHGTMKITNPKDPSKPNLTQVRYK